MEMKQNMNGWENGWEADGINNNQMDQKVSTYMMCSNKEEDWKTRDESEMVWDVLSLFASGNETLHVNNDELTNQQSAILWIECNNVVREKMMITRSIANEHVEAEIQLTLPIVGCSQVGGFSKYEETRRRDKLTPTFNL